MVARASWTYEVPPAGADAAALEDYSVETASGERVGKVLTLPQRNGDVLLAVEIGTPPLRHDVRVFGWEDVEDVDHEGLAVRLRVGRNDVEESLQLDPDKGVEAGEADAVRVTALPTGLAPSSPPSAGPVDRPAYGAALGLGALGLITLLGAVMLAAFAEATWRFAAFAAPVLLLAAAAVVGSRLVRDPYERANS